MLDRKSKGGGEGARNSREWVDSRATVRAIVSSRPAYVTDTSLFSPLFTNRWLRCARRVHTTAALACNRRQRDAQVSSRLIDRKLQPDRAIIRRDSN